MSDWLLLESVKVVGGDKIDSLGECERCGRLLYAAIYTVSDGSKTMFVGSGCCKIITGHTPHQLAEAEAERQRVEREEWIKQERQLFVKKWKIANAEIVAFLERKAAEAERSYNEQCERYSSEGGRFPSYNGFFASLLKYIEKNGTLTEKQAAAVERLMMRNENKALPKIKEKFSACGPVIRAIAKIDPYRSGYNHDSYTVEIDLDRKGVHVRIKANDSTKLYRDLELSVSRDLTVYNVPEMLSVRGTVKYAKNGLVVLTRAKLMK